MSLAKGLFSEIKYRSSQQHLWLLLSVGSAQTYHAVEATSGFVMHSLYIMLSLALLGLAMMQTGTPSCLFVYIRHAGAAISGYVLHTDFTMLRVQPLIVSSSLSALCCVQHQCFGQLQ